MVNDRVRLFDGEWWNREISGGIRVGSGAFEEHRQVALVEVGRGGAGTVDQSAQPELDEEDVGAPEVRSCVALFSCPVGEGVE